MSLYILQDQQLRIYQTNIGSHRTILYISPRWESPLFYIIIYQTKKNRNTFLPSYAHHAYIHVKSPSQD